MGIKHSVTKSSGEKGYAVEWNEEHVIDSDINMGGYGLFNTRLLVNDFGSLLVSADQYLELSGALGIIVDNEVNMSGQKITNLANPTSTQDAATKNYVDSQVGGGISYNHRTFTILSPADNWGNNTGTNISVGVSSGQKVLIMSSGSLNVGNDDWIQMRLARNSVGFANPIAELDDEAGQGATAPYSLCYLDFPGSGTFTYGIQSNYGGLVDIYNGYIVAIVFN